MDFAPTYICSVVDFLPPPGRLKLVTGVGDLMSPKIRPGEMALEDTGCTKLDVGAAIFDHHGTEAADQGAAITARRHLGAELRPSALPRFRLTDDSIIGGRVHLIQYLERVA